MGKMVLKKNDGIQLQFRSQSFNKINRLTHSLLTRAVYLRFELGKKSENNRSIFFCLPLDGMGVRAERQRVFFSFSTCRSEKRELVRCFYSLEFNKR